MWPVSMQGADKAINPYFGTDHYINDNYGDMMLNLYIHSRSKNRLKLTVSSNCD